MLNCYFSSTLSNEVKYVTEYLLTEYIGDGLEIVLYLSFSIGVVFRLTCRYSQL